MAIVENEVVKLHRKWEIEGYREKELECHKQSALLRGLVRDYTLKKAKYEAQKRELESLVGISCLDRMDIRYNQFVEAMQKASTEDEYKNLAEQFRSLEGYKDSSALADKCGKLADESAKLAVKTKYERLIREKNNASSEDKYKQLVKEFREMGSYENSAQLADECDKQIRTLKGQREERERQEAEKRKKEDAEQEALRKKEDAERKWVEEQRDKKKKILSTLRVILILFITLAGISIGLFFVHTLSVDWQIGIGAILVGGAVGIGMLFGFDYDFDPLGIVIGVIIGGIVGGFAGRFISSLVIQLDHVGKLNLAWGILLGIGVLIGALKIPKPK